jgi:hypothetical protein
MMRSTRQVFAHRLSRRFAGSLAILGTVCSGATALVAGLTLATSLAACDKPQEKDCKEAVANIRRIYGTQGIDYGADPQAMVRSCRGSASRDSVRCFIAAKSIEDLNACEGGTFTDMFGDEPDDQPKQPDDKPAPGAQPAPVNEPQQPAVVPQQPAVVPQQPAVVPQQPAAVPQQPAAVPQPAAPAGAASDNAADNQ